MLAFIAAGLVYFARPSIPEREAIEPSRPRVPTKKESTTVNLAKIYEYDLFDTYQKEFAQAENPEHLEPLPEPPSPMPVRIPEEPKPQFIEPLPVTLKGIIVILNDDSKNRVIIMDNRTNKETSYRVGDMIEDAQIIRIFSNKVILMRSNGQQEVLYLREKDAKMDPSYVNSGGNWQEVITSTAPGTFTVNTADFVSRVQSLGQFIDILEVTTAYKAGESVGCRIHSTGPGSLGSALGLQKDDLIVKVNDITVTSTQNRLAIYNQIMTLKTNDVIHVTLIRNGQEIVLNYILHEVHQARKQEVGLKPTPPDQLSEEQKKSLEARHTFAPTLKEIRTREKANMIEKTKRPAQNVLSNLNE